MTAPPQPWPRSLEWESILAAVDEWREAAAGYCRDFAPDLIAPEPPSQRFRRITYRLIDWCNANTNQVDPTALGELLGELSAPEDPIKPRYGDRMRKIWVRCEKVLDRLWYQGTRFEGEDEAMRAPGDPPALTVKKSTVNDRMMQIFTRDSECIEWSANEWADKLGCGKSTVVGTKVWKVVQKERGRRKEGLKRGGSA